MTKNRKKMLSEFFVYESRIQTNPRNISLFTQWITTKVVIVVVLLASRTFPSKKDGSEKKEILLLNYEINNLLDINL